MTSIIRHFAESIDDYNERRNSIDLDGASPTHDVFQSKVERFHSLIHDRAFKTDDLPAYRDALMHSNGIGLDDRELLLEKVLVLMSKLKEEPISMKIQQVVIDLLYKDLPHPPSSFLSAPDRSPPSNKTVLQKVNYAHRYADGSNYNPWLPSMGMAGSPYARSVPALKAIPKHLLPDPGLIFDTLLRREEFVEHPGGISSLFFAFADLVIHSLFKTNHKDWTINDTSSYLDLSILYGNSEKEVDSVRMKDGTGKLKNDVFADYRLLSMPAATCALLVLLNRNHNFIAQKLMDINECNYANPPPVDEKERLAQDDEIFHRSRLVNCGYFMQIILGDYVGAILGLVRDGSDWRLNPLMDMRELDHEVAPRGQGNVVSIEFNLMYRWHSTLSKEDAQWTADEFARIFPNKGPNDISVEDFEAAAISHLKPTKPVTEWTFHNLRRDSRGRFKDEDLARIIQDATSHRAGAFRARGIPAVLRAIEIMGIEQARSWGTCSLNEFRKFLGLKPYKTFKEWNNDEKIHTAAAALYKDIDNLELHVGLQAEQTKVPGPGAGLCPGYTISRAILADAVCLTRGDPFLTTEFTPKNLTAWGYQDCQYDKKDGSYGGMLTKLLYRTLPDYYPPGSAYAHFPFMDPVFMQQVISKRPGVAEQYRWERPVLKAPTILIDTYRGVEQALKDRDLVPAYSRRLFAITHKVVEFNAALEEVDGLSRGKANIESLLLSKEEGSRWARYFREEAHRLIEDHAVKDIKYINIVGDVINLLPVRWICEEISGFSLKTKAHPHNIWYEQEVYKMFADVGRYVFSNYDPVNDWHLRQDATSACQEICKVLTHHLKKVDDWVPSFSGEKLKSYDVLKRVAKSGSAHSAKDLATFVFSALVPTAAHYSQAIAHVVDFYLDDEREKDRLEIVKLTKSSDPNSISKVMAYVREALRLNPTVRIVSRTAQKDTDVGPIRVYAGQRVLGDIGRANVDPDVIGPNFASAVYDRPSDTAGIFGLGEHGLLSASFFEPTVVAVLGAIFELKHLRRGPGLSGNLAKYTEDWRGCKQQLYINSQGESTPFPDSLIVQFA